MYKNSIPAVAAVPVKNNKILLGRRSIDPQKGKWDVVGGFSDPGEHPEKTVLRETKEETDLDAKILWFIGIFMDKYLFKKTNYDVMVVYYAVEVAGDPKPADDVSELKWFDVDKLPEKEYAFEHLTPGLNDVKRWMKKNLRSKVV